MTTPPETSQQTAGTLHDTFASLRATLPPRSRVLGFDVGTKTIGLALSDTTFTVATPLETLKRSKWSQDLVALKAIISEHSVAGFVVGLPLNMDGTDSPRTQGVRAFMRNLLRETGLPGTFWDERWSTLAVERTLLEADTSRAKRRDLVDKMAASYILQGALHTL